MKNIVLTGFMCTGKTTIGMMIAKKIGFRFIDSDEYIEKVQKTTISEIFEKYGEERFREIEKESIKEISKLKNCVIATGGGVVLNRENVENLKANGVVFYLNASVKTILKRSDAIKKRPLIKNSTEKEIAERMEKRRPFYANNHFEINVDNLAPLQVCMKIIESYKNFVR